MVGNSSDYAEIARRTGHWRARKRRVSTGGVDQPSSQAISDVESPRILRWPTYGARRASATAIC